MGILVFPLIPDLLPSPQQLSTLHLSPFPGLQKSRRQAARICTLHPPCSPLTDDRGNVQLAGYSGLPPTFRHAQGPGWLAGSCYLPPVHSQVILCPLSQWLGFLFACITPNSFMSF